MILVDNIRILRSRNPLLLDRLLHLDNIKKTGNVIIEQAKTGSPTLKLLLKDCVQYVHSKYDPINEANRFISQFNIEETKHVLFCGVGLGYHIQAFLAAYPDISFSIFEPNEEVILAYLSHSTLDSIVEQNLSFIFTDHSSENIALVAQQLSDMSKGKLKIITLPIYEKVYSNEIAELTKKIVETLKQKSNSLAVNIAFQKRWTVNAIKNLPSVLNSPNFLHNINKSAFAGKPAIIIAAGPSLNEEIENLRYIKDNGLAYLFSVGSAINSLIEHGIYPDATCTYDPTETNYKVVQKIKDKKLDTIPLIFGSTVGAKTLENYPGKLLHMIISQDTIAPLLLKENQAKNLDFLVDAPSISIIMFQALCKLGVGQIILVGQNLGYLSDKYYADGIDTTGFPKEVQKQSLANAITMKDVHGNYGKTTEGYYNMRKQFEMYIAQSKHMNVINTTKGGASIEGTIYKPLSELLEKHLTKKVVHPRWFDAENNYNYNYLDSQLKSLTVNEQDLKNLLQTTIRILETIIQKVNDRAFSSIESDYSDLNRHFYLIEQNSFYRYFMAPMFRVQYEHFSDNVLSHKKEISRVKKYEQLINEYRYILNIYSEYYDFSTELFAEMKEQINAR